MTIPIGWAAQPLAERMHLIPDTLPIHVIYGEVVLAFHIT